MGCPAAACVSGMMACLPTGTRRVPCAAVGHWWASPPSHPHAAPRGWSRGCKRSRESTARHVRPGAHAHSYGALCPLALHPLRAEGRLWRCRSTTPHEPSRSAKAASADTVMGPQGLSGGRASRERAEPPDLWGTGPASPCCGAHWGPGDRSRASAPPTATDFGC